MSIVIEDEDDDSLPDINKNRSNVLGDKYMLKNMNIDKFVESQLRPPFKQPSGFGMGLFDPNCPTTLAPNPNVPYRDIQAA